MNLSPPSMRIPLRNTVLTKILFFTLLVSTHGSYAQERLAGFLRMGFSNIHTEGFSNINNHEAYVLGAESSPDRPLLFGFDLKYKINENWVISNQVDMSTRYTQRFQLLTNRYVLNNQVRIEEFHEYEFAPIFLNTSIGREFRLFKTVSIVPKLGAGMRFINQRGFNTIYSNSTETLNQLTLIHDSFQDSFKNFDAFMTFGVSVSYNRFYAEVQFRPSLSETDNKNIFVEDQSYDNNVQHDFTTFTLGYRIWSKY